MSYFLNRQRRSTVNFTFLEEPEINELGSRAERNSVIVVRTNVPQLVNPLAPGGV